MASDDETGESTREEPRPQRLGQAIAWQLLGGVVLLLLLWTLRDVLLLCFGAVIMSAIFRALGQPLIRRVGLSQRLAVFCVLVGIVLVLGIVVWWAGEPMAVQLQELRNALPKAWATMREWLRAGPLGDRLLQWIGNSPEWTVPWARVAGAATAATGALADFVLVLLLGIYLALDPDLYRQGVLRLLPERRRAQWIGVFDATGDALKGWILGQGVAMLLIGSTVGIGLAFLGMPLAPALGLISGLLEFVPFFGPIASALLSVLLAFTQGPSQAVYVAIFFVVIQQLEGNVILPLVQRWSVHLPPVLGLLGVVVFGSLFGVRGVILGTPLMVVATVLVNKLYVEAVLDADRLPG